VIRVNAYSSEGAVLLRFCGGSGSNLRLKTALWIEIFKPVYAP